MVKIETCTKQNKQNDVCLNSEKCKKLDLKKFKLVVCPCSGKYKYKCGPKSKYCSKNKQSCDRFKKSKLNNNHDGQIRICENSNKSLNTTNS